MRMRHTQTMLAPTVPASRTRTWFAISLCLLAWILQAVILRAEEKSPARDKQSTSAKGALANVPGESAGLPEYRRRYETLRSDLAGRARLNSVADETYHPASLIHDSDRDPLDIVLRRTRALLDDLKLDNPTRFEERLRELLLDARRIPVADEPARMNLFRAALDLRREIAFSNPLLDFEQLLFITRHRSGFNHMCDQYYGVHAKPGGRLLVLNDAFGDKPEVVDLLADSAVENGRLKGTRLDTGSFLSPDLSFDGKSVLFAYVESRGKTAHEHHTDHTRGHWAQGQCYHLFKVGTDGAGLTHLTDGTWNDFDPCWLPNGRVAFISERRGGYLRCGRACPLYTLYDMAPDGTDIRRLSFHDSNEWHPSVMHDGRITWTRWDYVDRHGCSAHAPWVTTPDGRDPRAIHGNYAPRALRPDMELDPRAIPGSNKLVATAAPHHGQSYGSLVLIDPQVEDDDAMAPVKRLTPEVAFPESQGGAQVYGTPWPLSEHYYLCVYDDSLTPDAGRQGGAHQRGDYGIYLVDVFGNKELIYRDPEIGSLSPIPLRSRPLPPVLPASIEDGREAKRPRVADTGELRDPASGTVAVVNVYDAMKPWPEGTTIKSLRVFQIFPMGVPSGNPPHETGMRLPTALDSINPVRYVLGTVPVEKDGSAHFTVPAEKPIFFQALDERGLAVQSMRSATYLQAGERMVCMGCHERKNLAPKIPSMTPLALHRPPSPLKPDVQGSNPFSYPHLVQPVLDQNCVGCHAKHPKTAPDLSSKLVKGGRRAGHWYASYANLIKDFGFYQYGDGYRTSPGKFGAKASKLYQLLEKGHYDVELTAEELHRITLWLDACSMFYGVYEKQQGEAQLRGETVRARLE